MLKVRESFLESPRVRLSRARAAIARVDKLFLFVVALPTFLATAYFGFLASDVYISESQFVVRSPDKPATTGLGVLLKSTGFSNDGDEVYTAQQYVKSRDALHELNRNHEVERAYQGREVSIFDRFNALGLSGTFEDLYHFYQNRVGVQYDSASSVATLSVRAFRPEDAFRLNTRLLQLSEDLVNRLNTRGRNDVLQFAQQEVEDAQRAAREAAVALAAFRNTHGVVDPEEQAKSQLEMVSKLQDELISSRMQLLQLQKIAPDNPQVPVLVTRIRGLQHEVDAQTGRVAGDRRSLSQTAVQYERLDLQRQFADRRLAAAMTSLQDAEEEAHRKQAYVERIAQPNLPDKPAEPHRLKGILATLILGLVAWALLKLIIAGIREHHA